MNSYEIKNEINAIKKLIASSYDKDALLDLILDRAEEASLYSSTVSLKMATFNGKVISGLLKKSRDRYEFVKSLKKWLMYDKGLKETYPKAIEELKNQDVDIVELFKKNIGNKINSLDEMTQDYVMQWVAVDLFTDLAQEAQAQKTGIFSDAENALSKGKDFNFKGYIASRIKNSINMFFRKKDYNETAENVWKLEDKIKKREELKDSLKNLDPDKDAKTVERIQKDINKVQTQINRIEKLVGTTQQEQIGMLSQKKVSPSMAEDDALRKELEKKEIFEMDYIMDTVDVLEDLSDKDLHDSFLQYAKKNGSKMAKKIIMLLFELNFEPTDKSDKSRMLQMAEELESRPDRVKEGVEDLKKLLVSFAMETKDSGLMIYLLNNAGFQKYHTQIKKDKDELEKQELKKQKEVLDKLKKSSSLDNRFSDIVTYIEKLFLKNM
jgi:hypothetical protein